MLLCICYLCGDKIYEIPEIWRRLHPLNQAHFYWNRLKVKWICNGTIAIVFLKLTQKKVEFHMDAVCDFAIVMVFTHRRKPNYFTSLFKRYNTIDNQLFYNNLSTNLDIGLSTITATQRQQKPENVRCFSKNQLQQLLSTVLCMDGKLSYHLRFYIFNFSDNSIQYNGWLPHKSLKNMCWHSHDI